jgi:hypothetical protein
VTERTLSRWETDELTGWTRRTDDLAKLYGTSVANLMGDVDRSPAAMLAEVLSVLDEHGEKLDQLLARKRR